MAAQLQPLSFGDAKVGDTLHFLTTENGFDGRGIYSRTGRVTSATAKSLTVVCDDRSTARLTKATWHYREPRKVV
jgi:hypothetical protein